MVEATPDAADATAGVADDHVAVALKRSQGHPLVVEVAPLRGGGKAGRVLVPLGPALPEPTRSTPTLRVRPVGGEAAHQ